MSNEELDRPEGVAGRLHDRLTEAAAKSEIVSYSELEDLLKLDMRSPDDRRKIGVWLGEISRWEVARGRPMLSSVVWHKDLSGPGRGFYNLVVELGLVHGGEDELAFATRQLLATQAEWSRRAR